MIDPESGSVARRNGGYDPESNTILLNLFGNDGKIVSGERLAELGAHENSESRYQDHERAERSGDYASTNYNWANWLNGIVGTSSGVSNSDWLAGNAGSVELNLGNLTAINRPAGKSHNISVSMDTELMFLPWMGESGFVPESAQIWASIGSGC